jgi:ribose transport system permease protein
VSELDRTSDGAPAPVSVGLSQTLRRLSEGGLLLPLGITIVLLAIGAAVTPNFVASSNIWSLLSIASLLALASIGQTQIIIAGKQGIDLSVGSVMTLGALIASAQGASLDGNLPLAVLQVICASALVGVVNFCGIYYIGIYPLIMTLGMAFVVSGAAFVYVQAQAPSMPSPILLALGGGKVGPVPWLVILAAVMLCAMTWVLTRTRYGQRLYLVGANERAARLSGVPVAQVYLTAYTGGAILAGLSGILLFGFAGSVNLAIGEPYTLLSIATAVVGGTALTGGRGNLVGTYLGALVFTVLTNLLMVLGLSTAIREVLSGLVLIAILVATARESGLRA